MSSRINRVYGQNLELENDWFWACRVWNICQARWRYAQGDYDPPLLPVLPPLTRPKRVDLGVVTFLHGVHQPLHPEGFQDEPRLPRLLGCVLMMDEIREIQRVVQSAGMPREGIQEARVTPWEYFVYEEYTHGHTNRCWITQLRNLRCVYINGCEGFLNELNYFKAHDLYGLRDRHLTDRYFACTCGGRHNRYVAGFVERQGIVSLVYKLRTGDEDEAEKKDEGAGKSEGEGKRGDNGKGEQMEELSATLG